MVFLYIELYSHANATQQREQPMTTSLAHIPDPDSRVEKLAVRLGLKGSGRKTATTERALALF